MEDESMQLASQTPLEILDKQRHSVSQASKTQEASPTESLDVASSDVGKSKKKRKTSEKKGATSTRKRSEVWKHFSIVTDVNGVSKCSCNYCEKLLAGNIGTSGMSNNIKTCLAKNKFVVSKRK